jgi:ParB-like chromosome segregation protein Spo0J
MKIEQVHIDELIPAPYNPRRMDEVQFNGLKASLKVFGIVEPVVANKRNKHIVGGHMRVEAWFSMGNDTIPVVWVDLDDKQEKKLNVLLNSQAISGKYDQDKLAEILTEFSADDDYSALRLDELEPADGSSPKGDKVPCPTCGTKVDPSKLD